MFPGIGQRLHSDQMTASEVVTETALQQIRQLRSARLERLQKQSGICDLVAVRRLRKHFEALLVRGSLFGWIKVKVEMGENLQVRKGQRQPGHVLLAR